MPNVSFFQENRLHQHAYRSLFPQVPSAKCHVSPPVGPHSLDVPYRPDRRLYLGKSSTLPAQENTTPCRFTEMATLPGGATPTHTNHQRWSNPGDSSPAWGSTQHTCRRPLTEYRVCSQDLTIPKCTEWDGRRLQGSAHEVILKPDCKAQTPPKVPRSITDLDLSGPHVSSQVLFGSVTWFEWILMA